MRAREDPAFKHQLVAASLEFLLRELSRLRRSTENPTQARQLREGVDLALRLAKLLQRIGGDAAGGSRAA